VTQAALAQGLQCDQRLPASALGDSQRKWSGVRGARKHCRRSGLTYKTWTLSSARGQWGSCTHDGRIRLNWRLVHFALPVIDYVVEHELAHVREMNHSPRFWTAVGQLLPGFEAARDEIKGVDLASL
jgi:predicted metal-dependent hydrolase